MESKANIYDILLQTIAHYEEDVAAQKIIFKVLIKTFLEEAPKDYVDFIKYVKNFSDCSLKEAKQFTDLIFIDLVK